MARFRNGLINVLVATDVAARGIDVDDIEAVFNYDIPQDVEYYVHRIGRTGRAGKEGRAYTFVVGREVARMWEYRKITGAKILCQKAPDAADVQKALRERVIKDIVSHCGDEISETSLEAARALMAENDAERAVAVMLDMLIRSTGARTDASVDLTPPEPIRTARPEAPRTVRRVGPYGQPATPAAKAGFAARRQESIGSYNKRNNERGNGGYVNRKDRDERNDRRERFERNDRNGKNERNDRGEFRPRKERIFTKGSRSKREENKD